MPPLFSIIIPHWNGAHHLPDCFDSLRRQTLDAFEVLLVDNASTDATFEVLARYPEVKVIALERNFGFTGACNAGFRRARGTYQVLLNNDTAADPEWLASLACAFADYPDAGFVASKMLLFDRRDTFHTAGDYVTLDGLAHNRGVWERDAGQFDAPAYVFSACGGSAAYRKTLLDAVGLLDDDFFFSFEDVDLAWRAQLAGWRCLYQPRAVVYHKLKASGGGATASFYDARNRLWTLAKNYPADLWRDHRREVVGAQVKLALEAARAWRGAAARATLRGLAAGMLGLPRALRKRRAIQSARRVEREYLLRLMTPPYVVSPEEHL